MMTALVRSFLSLEASVFGAAALIHAGVLATGYEHAKAQTAETVIALALIAGLVATVISPLSSRTIGLAAQAFALAGTLVGLFTIAVGVGPRTALDLALHVAMIALLVSGLLLVARRRAIAATARHDVSERIR
jgi:hypothetical protein